MPQIHFWFLHYSLLNILTRLPENYIEHQEFFVNSDFLPKFVIFSTKVIHSINFYFYKYNT